MKCENETNFMEWDDILLTTFRLNATGSLFFRFAPLKFYILTSTLSISHCLAQIPFEIGRWEKRSFSYHLHANETGSTAI